jgi:ketosteroid isomerase-like protein
MKTFDLAKPGERLCVLCLGAHSDDIEIGHVQLYTEDATLFGSVDELQTGRDGIRDYFGGLHAGVRVEAYPMPRTTALATDVTVTGGYVDFADDDGPIPYRMTWVLVRRDGNWRIAQHHGSPRRSP